MRRIMSLFAAVVAALGAFASPALAQDAGRGPADTPRSARVSATVPISYLNAAGLSADELQTMRAEVAGLFGQLGVTVRETEYDALTSEASRLPGFHIVVTLLANKPSSFGLAPRTMGFATLVAAADLPYRAAHIFVAGVRQTLGECDANPRGDRLGKALATVIVHELVHILAPGYGHGDRVGDLMAPALRCTSLVGSQGPLERESATALLAGLAMAHKGQVETVVAGHLGRRETRQQRR